MTSSSNASASMPSARTARVYGSGGPATGSSGRSSPQRRQTSVAGPPSNGADLVFLQIGVHSMGTIFQQHRRLVSSRNCVVGSAAFFLVIWS